MKEGMRVVGLKQNRPKRRTLYYESWFGNTFIESGATRQELINKFGNTITIKPIR